MKIKYLSLILIMAYATLSQERIEIKNIFIEDYPTIRAEVEAYDAAGEQFREFADLPITLTEDGQIIPLTNQFCETDAVKYSLIVVADISESMKFGLDGEDAEIGDRRIDVLQRSLIEMTNLINPSNAEFALLTFGGQSEIYVDFTQDLNSARELINELGDIQLKSRTDYNAAFQGIDTYNDDAGIGAIPYSANAKWKPIILFFSDGRHNVPQADDGNVRDIQIRDQAIDADCIVFSAQLGGSTPGSITTIVNGTGGTSYPALNTENQLREAFSDILREVEENPAALPPCEIEWITDCDQNEIVVEGTINSTPVSATATYNVPDNVKPSLEIDNRNPTILNNQNAQITITARNSDVTINDANISDGNFQIPGINGVTLIKDVPQTFDIVHNDNNPDCSPTDITFNSTACFGNEMAASSGFLSTQNVFIGGGTPGVPTNSVEVCFNNNFCRDVTIENIRIENGDDGFFPFTFPGPTNVAQGTTASFDFTYFPDVPGTHSSDLIITVDGVDYNATITGSSSGLPEIATNVSTQADDVVCDETSQIVIEVTNPGPVPLEVTDIQLDNTTDFQITSNLNFTVSENNTQTEQIIIQFDPQSPGIKNANLTIVNNSNNEPNRVIAISGRELSLLYEAESSTSPIDLGVICPDESVEFDIIINETGEASSVLTIDDSAPELNFDGGTQLDFTLGNDSQLIKKATFSSSQEGTFDIQIPITDDCGNDHGFARVIGEVREATTIYDNSEYDYTNNNQLVNIQSDINTRETVRLTLVNEYPRPLENISVDILGDPDGVFVITENDEVAPSNGQYNVTVEFTPIASQNYSLELFVTAEVDGNNCLNQSLVPLTASTSLASAEFQYNDVQALIGQDFQIDVPNIIPQNNFLGVGINAVEIEVVADSRLVESRDVAPTRNEGNNSVWTYLVDPADLAQLNFTALDPGDPTLNSTPIEFRFIDTEPAGLATVSIEPITFNLVRAKADIGTNEITAKPGEAVTVNINSSDFVGVDPNFHRAISGQLRFNASLLYPAGNTPMGNIVNEGGINYRIIDFTLDLNGNNSQGVGQIITSPTNTSLTLDFTALLGDSPTTDLEIINPTAEVGVIEFEDFNLGVFNLDPTCIDENGNILRLFDPFTNANAITVDGNPSNSRTSIKLELIEDGYHYLSFVDLNGNVLEVLLDDKLSHGKYEYSLETSKYTNGVYMIMLQTPTQKFSEEIIISK